MVCHAVPPVSSSTPELQVVHWRHGRWCVRCGITTWCQNTTHTHTRDHQAVVLHFVGLRLDGHRPNRWKFPLDDLRDSVVVDCVADGICLQVPLVWVVFVVFYVVCHGCSAALLQKVARPVTGLLRAAMPTVSVQSLHSPPSTLPCASTAPVQAPLPGVSVPEHVPFC